MKPATLVTERLVLDQPTLADVDLTTSYCQDPLFERFMVTPWPYTRADALGFFVDYVPLGWERDSEYSWALRHDGQFLGIIGFRPAGNDVGYWIGAPHRRHGYMTEALSGVLDWLFAQGFDDIQWECFVGNVASASVARKNGFAFTGQSESHVFARDGSQPPALHGVLSASDSREPKPGWPKMPSDRPC
jgi:RimJ/RimL family protein N-acetyltransferase